MFALFCTFYSNQIHGDCKVLVIIINDLIALFENDGVERREGWRVGRRRPPVSVMTIILRGMILGIIG